ncbi:hypothetical protein O3P69_008162 [Scylla paramamosain]|uniref:Uncharacterized protein n=1 Tax=Scylla paramamosain TaxID=85552 RepID=A0AAW0T263_SCYPA
MDTSDNKTLVLLSPPRPAPAAQEEEATQNRRPLASAPNSVRECRVLRSCSTAGHKVKKRSVPARKHVDVSASREYSPPPRAEDSETQPRSRPRKH